MMIEVIDRVPTYPGRVKLVPVADQENTYDMVRADDPIEAGTPINRALFESIRTSMLTEKSAAMFGMDSSAVADDVFSFLGKYNQHVWERRCATVTTMYKAVWVDPGIVEIFHGKYAVYESAEVDELTGEIVLGTDITATHVPGAKDVYIKSTGSGIYQSPSMNETDVFYISKDAGAMAEYKDYIRYGSGVKILRSESYEVRPTEYTLVYSNSEDTYPHSGPDATNTFEYRYLGIPYENAAIAPKFATGSYVGTGVYPFSLTFGFNPRVVLIARNLDQWTADKGGGDTWSNPVYYVTPLHASINWSTTGSGYGYGRVTFEFTSNGITVNSAVTSGSNNGLRGPNHEGFKYYYFALA